jgi:hypothetical protein
MVGEVEADTFAPGAALALDLTAEHAPGLELEPVESPKEIGSKKGFSHSGSQLAQW